MNNIKNDHSGLVAALVCVCFAIITFLFKWVSLYFMEASIWEVADTIGNLGRYADEGGYVVMAGIIRIGAIAAIALLALDGYRMAKPLLNNSNDPESACNSGAGAIASISYAVIFCLMVAASNNGDMEGATITLWPFVNVGLCIVSRVLMSKLNSNARADTWRNSYPPIDPLTPVNASKDNRSDTPHNVDENNTEERNDTYIDIPITNYDADNPLQPSILRCLPNSGKLSLIIAAYRNPEKLQALRVRFEFKSVFGDSFSTDAIPFLTLKRMDLKSASLLTTEYIQSDILKAHLREIESARAIIDAIRTSDDSIPLPANYWESDLSVQELKRLKKGINLDAVCETKEGKTKWRCICGRINTIEMEKCVRCGRPVGTDDYGVIIEQLEAAAATKELFQVLDDAIENGMDSLSSVKMKYDKLRFLTFSQIREMMVRDIENLQE